MSNIHAYNGGYITKSKPILARNLLQSGSVNFGLYWNPPTSKWIDTSTNAISITTSTQVRFDTASPYASGGLGNLYIANSVDSATTPLSATSSTFTFGSGDFTIATWVYSTSTLKAYNCVFEGASAGGGRTNSLVWYFDAAGKHHVFVGTEIGPATSTSTAVALNSWTHIALVRSGGVAKIYHNGVTVGDFVGTIPTVTTNYMALGRIGDNNSVYPGKFANYIVVSGKALYTSNFTPPTAETGRTYSFTGSVNTTTYGVYMLS